MLLVDTNVWLAAADRRSEDHAGCVALLSTRAGELVAPAPVVSETSWLILDRLGADAHGRFLDLIVGKQLEVIDLTRSDWERTVELCDRYRDLRLDVMDACLVAVAERLGLTMNATMNHRDFTVIRPQHCDAFTLVPPGPR